MQVCIVCLSVCLSVCVLPAQLMSCTISCSSGIGAVMVVMIFPCLFVRRRMSENNISQIWGREREGLRGLLFQFPPEIT